MTTPDDDNREDELLRSVALQNARSVLHARQQAEDALREAKAALELRTLELAKLVAAMHATLEATSDAILVVVEGQRFIDFNQRFVDLWRVSDEIMRSGDCNLLLQAVKDQLKDPDIYAARLAAIDAEGPAESHDVLECEDGRVLEQYSRVQYIGSTRTGRVFSFRDVTERVRLLKNAQAARDEAERASASKDEFLALLSHELRTPVSAILGWTQVLRMRADHSDGVRDGLNTIERNARAQIQLIEDLLDMSRITSGRLRLDMQALEPATFVEAAILSVLPAADAKAVRIEKFLDPRSGPVSGDPNRLQQVLWNLLANAVKFTPKSGKVQVRLERVNSDVEISIADSGIGITPEFLPHVFERFRQADASSTREHAGLGLGLSIVKHLVELHGGTVRAASPGENRGATFVVRLPLKVIHDRDDLRDRVHPHTSASLSGDFKLPDLSGLKVLVVDDNPDGRELIKRILAQCRAEVHTSANAESAILSLESERPNILITDIGMPGVDGYELLGRIRALGAQRGGNVPAIALTAFARSEDRTRALGAGFLAHMVKPVEPTELCATVAAVTGRAGDKVQT